jgi:radical SAM superfamily enzyme YgiQ (UPF0313 family)
VNVLLAVKSKKMENLGVMYLSAVAKRGGHECKIVTFDEVKKYEKWTDVLGYSVMTGDQDLVKRIHSGIKAPCATLVGGPHPTFFPDDFEGWNVVKGDGENFMSEFLGGPVRPFLGIDSIPFPDRTDFPGMKIRDFIATRGCPYDCSYCYNQKWAEMFPNVPRVQTRSVGSLVKEILYTDPEFVYFQDSCFALNMTWLREFSRVYKKDVRIPFHCHLRPNQIVEERVILLAEAGCYSTRIALESASPRLRTLVNRKMSNADVYFAARLLKKWGIKTMIQNIIGLPTGTIEEDLETLEMNIRLKPDYGWVSIFSPYPGTKLGDRCRDEKWYTGDYSDISDSFFDTSVLNISNLYREQLECLQKIFALCVEVGYLPRKEELVHERVPKLTHDIMRKLGDRRLYGGVI